MPDAPRIALIHATPVAMAPIHAAMAEGWPEARPFDLLESALSQDAQNSDTGPKEFDDRFLYLSRYARVVGAEGILCTCSAFGPSLANAARALAPLPMLKPNEAMFEAALGMGKNIAMVATFEPAVAEMEAEFRQMSGHAAQLTTVVARGAIDALRAGDGETHDQLVCEVAAGLSGFDAIMLAHFSTARAKAKVKALTITPILSSPSSAVDKLRAICR